MLTEKLTRTQANGLFADVLRSKDSAALRRLVLEDLYFLLVCGCRRRDLNTDFHFDRCKEISSAPDGSLDLWFREAGKSSIITFGLTIQDILNDPEVTIGIFSHTRPIAKSFLTVVAREFEINTFLQDLFPNILYKNPAKESPRWSLDGGIIVKRRGNPKEATVEAHGLVDGQPTSRHYQVLVYDDVCVPASVTSPEMIDKTTDAWGLSLNLGAERTLNDGTVRPCRKRYIGTRYHHSDTYSKIIERGAAIPRIYYPTDLGKKDIDVDGNPVLFSREYLLDKRKTQGVFTYGCQMLQDPTADKSAGFNIDWLRYYAILKKHERWNFYLMCDPASEKKKTSDYSVFVVIGMAEDGNYYLVDGVRDKMNLTERTAKLFELHRKWQPKNTGYEKYGMQSDIEHIEYMQEQEGYRFRVTPLGGAMPKNDRIRRLVPIFEQGRFYIPYKLLFVTQEKRAADFIRMFVDDEYVNFPVGSHDDMCLIGETVIKTERGDIQIKDVIVGDRVLTRNGYQKVLASTCTGVKEIITSLGVTGTADHPVITKNGVKRLDSIHVDDILYIWNEKLLNIEEKSIIGIQNQNVVNTPYTSGDIVNGRLRRSLYIDKSTLITLDQFQKDLSFITKMKTRLTTTLLILRRFLDQNICNCTQASPLTSSEQRNTPKKFYIQKQINKKQENGNKAPQEWGGIRNTPKTALEKRKVYNLAVENNNEYFANNILVHNCDVMARILDEDMQAVFPKLEPPKLPVWEDAVSYDPMAVPK